MSYKMINSLFTTIALWVVLPALLAFQSDKPDKIMEMTKKMDARINFYGKVLDDHDQPVQGAEVMLQISRFSPNPAAVWTAVVGLSLKTDKDGNFMVHGERGSSLFVAKIKKEHYDTSPFGHTKTERGFHYDQELHVPYVPDSQNPVVYHLRKKGLEAFLLKGGGGFEFISEESGWYKGRDYFREGPAFAMKESELARPTVYGRPVVCDLRAQATLDPRSGAWTVVLAPGNPEGGVQSSDQLLYEAPTTGYQPSLTFKVEGKASKDIRNQANIDIKMPVKYLYLRSRNEPIYSRIEMSERFMVRWRPSAKDPKTPTSELSFGIRAVINPYGDRILEEATDLPGELHVRLGNEVLDSYNKGVRPSAPDLQKLVQEWGKNHPLKDKVKDWLKR